LLLRGDADILERPLSAAPAAAAASVNTTSSPHRYICSISCLLSPVALLL